MADVIVDFGRRPSATSFMLNALRPSLGLRAAGGFPQITARWRGYRIDRDEVRDFLDLTGLSAGSSLPILFPHVVGFRLHMVVLIHPTFPIPIWGALQTRNHLLQHEPVPVDAAMDMQTGVAAQRVLEKGAEVDLYTTVKIEDRCVWESICTFYYRGQFGQCQRAPTPREPPQTPSTVEARRHLPSGVGWRFARLTGDYNGIHRWHWYARLFGFRRAFFHPQMIAGQCMARLRAPEPGRAQRLDLWLKGPVHFDADVVLCAAAQRQETAFSLMLQGDRRPAMLGRWAAAEPYDQLLDAPTAV
jgi:hypothetical protein